MNCNRKKLRLHYRLKIEKVDGAVSKVSFTKKMKIYSIYKHEKVSGWNLEVVYLPKVTNSGSFKTRDAMLSAFRQWAEPGLLDFVSEGVWS